MDEDEFFVTLLSNASYDIYPENNVYNFTNVLAHELNFPSSEKWRVCLSSISLSNSTNSIEVAKLSQTVRLAEQKFKLQSRQVKIYNNTIEDTAEKEALVTVLHKTFNDLLEKKNQLFNAKNQVFIECSEITSKFETSKVLSSFTLPTKSDNNFFTYEPTTEEYFDLASPRINSFHIEIRNQKENLTSNVAQPTIIVLKFKKMENEKMEYHTMNVVNNASDSPSNFLTAFPDRLVKDGHQNSWEVAVTRVGLVPLFHTFPEGGFSLTVLQNCDDYYMELTAAKWESYVQKKMQADDAGSVVFTYVQKDSIPGLLVRVDNYLAHACELLKLESKIKVLSDGKVRIEIKQKDGEKKLSQKTIVLMLPIELFTVLGFNSEKAVFHNGYAALKFQMGKGYTGVRMPDLSHLQPKNLLVYTDCVRPSLIGNVYGQYLTNIPIPNEAYNDNNLTPYIFHEPKNLEFHKLLVSELNNVRFRIVKSNGVEPVFTVPDIRLFFTLLFRRKIKS